jgi:NCS2 family nucleobase:cation symporter-2
VGLVVAMVGISVIKISTTSLFGLTYHSDAMYSTEIIVGTVSLLIMVLLNLWGKGILKMYCLLIGMFSGWILALILLPENWQNLMKVWNKPVFAIPHFADNLLNIKFNVGMLIPFIVIAISGSLKSFGNLLAAQKISEPELEKPNFIPIRKGLLADGFSTALAGVLGGLAVDTSSSNVGLAGATKVVSRWISVMAGVIFIVLAFFPQVTAALSVMPKPVLGAALVFAACFMICTGFLEMFSEGWDQRKTFVVGIAIFLGLSTAFLPGLYARTPHFIQTFFTDPLPTTTILAVVLHQIFNMDLLFKKGEKEEA